MPANVRLSFIIVQLLQRFYLFRLPMKLRLLIVFHDLLYFWAETYIECIRSISMIYLFCVRDVKLHKATG